VKTKINGDTWEVLVVTPRQMKKQRDDGEHLAGLCIPSEKRIFIAKDSLDYETVLHEVFHAFVSGLHLDDTNSIPIEEIEEIYASFFTQKAQTMINKAKSILKKLNQEAGV
jgi:hypothetical protein